VTWLREAYIRLAEKPSLPLSEVRELDWQTQTHIYYIRDEGTCRTKTKRTCYDCGTIHQPGLACPFEAHKLVDEVFKEEFKALALSS